MAFRKWRHHVASRGVDACGLRSASDRGLRAADERRFSRALMATNLWMNDSGGADDHGDE